MSAISPCSLFKSAAAFLACGVWVHLFLASEWAAGDLSPDVPQHVSFASNEGRTLLMDATCSESYWRLASCHVCQPDLGSCGIASCCAVLNSIDCERPQTTKLGRYRWFTVESLFTPGVVKVVTREKVARSGMTLQELGDVLRVFPVDVVTQFASDGMVGEFREQIKRTLSSPLQRIVVNYSRPALGQEGGGHISPLGAYNANEDMVLVLDTASYKYPWTWVPVEQLWRAMADQVDRESGRTRGFVILTERKK